MMQTSIKKVSKLYFRCFSFMVRKESPKILIVTTPIRPIPTDFAPLGSLSILSALGRAGFENYEFYNIDYLRPEYSEILSHIRKMKPDILGISAVVSTAYAFVKKISIDIKKLSPQTTILMGGNLGASAEIILKKSGVDYICTGEGEKTIVDFANCWMAAKTKSDYSQVKGLSYLDEQGELVVTPFVESIGKDEVYDIDWTILEKLGQIDFFFPRKEEAAIIVSSFSGDPRTSEPHRVGKRVAIIPGSKGCVARCTFCHRWDKGIRYVPISVLMERIDFYIQRYNVGFLNFADENFGTDRKWLVSFIEEIKKRDLLWRVGGMRVNTITSDLIKQMKEGGCVSIYYGMESGSQTMLDVMEKVTKVEQNYNAVKWMAENDVFTIIQLIVGMPGENPKTIKETIEFTSYYVEQSPKNDPNALSINFAQALPGTPLYEVGRRQGGIGQTLDEEEQYLLEISDRDARDAETNINFTHYPRLLLEKWHFEIQNRTRHAYIKKWGLNNYHKIICQSPRYKGLEVNPAKAHPVETGYFADPARQRESFVQNDQPLKPQASSDAADSFNQKEEEILSESARPPSLVYLLRQKSISVIATYYPNLIWRFRFFILFLIFANSIRKYGFKNALGLLIEYIGWKVNVLFGAKSHLLRPEHISLRKLLKNLRYPEIPGDNPAMALLRKGR
jgi:anaerobic magnesium-protoporphyrin IX monomethyl ester cyclase